MNRSMIYLSLAELGRQNGFQISFPWDATYGQDILIWNRRLQSGPAMVAFCNTALDVAACLSWCRDNKFPFRVRSGGHHHEGLSSDWDTLVIDLSNMNTITYVGNGEAWIPPGKQLQFVYKELGARGWIIPGGGCETVCVGGLTLGGGWGMSARMYGMTCDNLLNADVVLADGTIATNIAVKPQYADLFWALKGGGAGNFGVVTRFLFRLSKANHITTFSAKWTGAAAVKKVMHQWLQVLESTRPAITTACRLYMDSPGEIAFLLFGQVFGSADDAKKYLEQFSILSKPVSETYSEKLSPPPVPTMPTTAESAVGDTGLSASQVVQDVLHFSSGLLNTVAPGAPSDTCLSGPLPHKVSSAFVKNKMLADFAEQSMLFLQNNKSFFNNASAYLSLHHFGGNIRNVAPDQTAFPYRDRLLLLQFQAWWSDPVDPASTDYICWIQNFRTWLAEKGITDGGFFNFQDMDIVPGYDGSNEQRHTLLRYYYGEDNLKRLIAVKNKYDAGNIFNSPMSVPLE
jgi:hypothetical protein